VRTDDLDYKLPDELIATEPAQPRDSARLLLLHRQTGQLAHHHVRDLPSLGILRAGDLILVNQTRVLPALLTGTRQATGGKITGLYVDSDGPGLWRVMLESRGKLNPGESIVLGSDTHNAANNTATLTLIEPIAGGQWRAQLQGDQDTLSVLARIGATPLPPYIRKQRKKLGQDEVNADDPERYNTVYAASPGSVAAPTAGLHFTPQLLDELDQLGVKRAAVDLHVGMGTFAPVRTDRVEDHPIHAEAYTVPRQTLDAIRQARESGGRLLVVGTTTVRALESLPADALAPDAHPDGVTGQTHLFIHPDSGFQFRFTDRLMTNFHLPRSTLLALVASMPGVGMDRLMAAYRTAVGEQYRFYSYGDAMLVV